ncbi:MAG: hypothetical protein C0490_09275 [Marivirga sp.]|nr:hypothetical protein [Marivirga sp.]
MRDKSINKLNINWFKFLKMVNKTFIQLFMRLTLKGFIRVKNEEYFLSLSNNPDDKPSCVWSMLKNRYNK